MQLRQIVRRMFLKKQNRSSMTFANVQKKRVPYSIWLLGPFVGVGHLSWRLSEHPLFVILSIHFLFKARSVREFWPAVLLLALGGLTWLALEMAAINFGRL